MTSYLGCKLDGLAIAISLFFGLLADVSVYGQDTRQLSSGVVKSEAKQTLRCYQCENQTNNTFCSRDTDLSLCQTKYTSNVCSTKISSSPETGLRITKQCDTGPCSLGTLGSRALGFDRDCDRTKPKWSCSSCCSGDGCNISPGHRITLALTTILVTLFLPFVYSRLYSV